MSGGNWFFGCPGDDMPCSSCGRSRGRGPRSAPTTLAWIVYNADGAIMWVRQSRAEAARDVRTGNAAIPRDQIGPSYRWAYEARKVPIDGSSELGEAMRTGRCMGCQDGRVPVQPREDDGGR